MKNIRIEIKILIAILFLTSCNNEFLERYPLDRISMETFWNTENDLQAYNNNLYYLVHNGGNVPFLKGHPSGQNYDIWYLDFFSDNTAAVTTRSAPDYLVVRSGKHFATTTPRPWGYTGWEFLRAVNIGIANYDKADAAQSTIDKYKAEARLFRGLFYADKVSKFGDVPYVDKELNVDSEELYMARTPREQVMEKVLADLDFACEKLPADWGDGNAPGRLNKWAALLLKSRVCLFEGTWRKYHGGTNPDMWLQQAAIASKALIDGSPYSIYSTGDKLHDYNAYHRMLDLTGISEVIYWEKFVYGIKMNSTMGYWRELHGCATKSFVEDYLCTDGLPITLSPLYQGDAQIEDVFENRDPRLRQTILHPDDGLYYQIQYNDAISKGPWIDGMTGNVGPTVVSGYHVIKIFERTMDIQHNQNNTSTTPAVILRLAEGLLNYAEARAELGALTQGDLDITINKLRDRVGMPHMKLDNIPVDPRYVNDGVSPLLVEIRRERRIELFLEGFRYDDLRRWKQGKKLETPSMGLFWDEAAEARYAGAAIPTSVDPVSGKTYLDVYKGTSYENPVFDESKHYLWPLPINVLSQNPELGQNPGW
ncbi:Starch-binding associating with outer membrane [Mariniphaga anaerophila]|uniref:Starch-binding associating with outer membrane n=1 Tax=Mariniphaga anaerophila TaxID=1484053 RepID=A0A1M4ZT43_9BACT|nr:RagB/SusD family nutrient uptake outer membrane protein [Mariniphaga anaerophila]SHF20726.1 Starch-binding associating with outer membrane [Mariniphaga anaerophila]